MSHKLTFNEFLERANKTHEGENLTYDESTFKGSHQKIRIICPKHVEFWQIAKEHMNGQGCPICGKEKSGLKRRITTTEFISEYKQRYDNNLDFSKFKYIKANVKSIVICPTHGEFQITPNNLLKGEGCPICSNQIRKKKNTLSEQVVHERLKKYHGDKISCNYSDYIKYNQKMTFYCKIHGSFEALPLNVLRGSGCPKCGIDKNRKERTPSWNNVLKRFRETHGDKYTYDESTYVSSKIKMRMLCPKHGEFWQTPMNHYRGNGCPICKESKLEMELNEALKENNIEYICQRPLERQFVDFYIPKLKLNIECQGEQHFKIKFGGLDDFKDCLKRDFKKKFKIEEKKEKIIYFTKKNLLPKNLNDKNLNSIYTNDNMFYDTDSIIKFINNLQQT